MTKLNLQLFAAQEGVTTTASITAQAREIDFVTSFTKSIQPLLDILGISRPIKKANGTTLYKTTASGTLKSGAVGEGEKIPFSEIKAKSEALGPIAISKYAKAVTLEAISANGYDVAVAKCDDEFRTLLANKVTGDFYGFLGTGTLESEQTTFQMAVSMAIGQVKNKFQQLGRAATGVAVFANTLDVYQYLGSAAITTQSAFGMSYVKDFLGADVMFLSSSVPQGKVEATPINNIIMYYVDPADSEFAKAGLAYTTDGDLPIIGFHTEGSYDYAQSESYALMGIKLMAEYVDGISVVTIKPATQAETQAETQPAKSSK